MPTERTVVLFENALGDHAFFVFDADLRKFDGVYCNLCAPDEYTEEQADAYAVLQDELEGLVYDDAGNVKPKEISKDEAIEAIRQGAHFVICGFVP